MPRFEIGNKIYSRYIDTLGNLAEKSPGMIGKAIYKGAAIVADAMKAEINAIPLGHGINQKIKDGLSNGFGVSRMKEENGYYNVKLGFDGYDDYVTKAYPKGHPVAYMARAIQKGTAYRPPIKFVDRAVKATKAQAEQAMQKEFDKELNKGMK